MSESGGAETGSVVRTARLRMRGERWEDILDAARRAFLKKGFHGASMRDVCDEAAMSPGNVYRYHRSKEAIVAAVVRRELASRAAPPDMSGDPVAGILAWILSGTVGGLASEIQSEAQRNADVRRMLLDAEAAARIGLATRLNGARGPWAPDAVPNPYSAAEILCALRDGLSLRKSLGNSVDPVSLERVLREMICAIVDGRSGDHAFDPVAGMRGGSGA